MISTSTSKDGNNHDNDENENNDDDGNDGNDRYRGNSSGLQDEETFEGLPALRQDYWQILWEIIAEMPQQQMTLSTMIPAFCDKLASLKNGHACKADIVTLLRGRLSVPLPASTDSQTTTETKSYAASSTDLVGALELTTLAVWSSILNHASGLLIILSTLPNSTRYLST